MYFNVPLSFFIDYCIAGGSGYPGQQPFARIVEPPTVSFFSSLSCETSVTILRLAKKKITNICLAESSWRVKCRTGRKWKSWASRARQSRGKRSRKLWRRQSRWRFGSIGTSIGWSGRKRRIGRMRKSWNQIGWSRISLSSLTRWCKRIITDHGTRDASTSKLRKTDEDWWYR